MLLIYDEEKTIKDFFKIKKDIYVKIKLFIKINKINKECVNFEKNRKTIVILKSQIPFLNEKLKNYNLVELWIKSKNNIFINFLDKED